MSHLVIYETVANPHHKKRETYNGNLAFINSKVREDNIGLLVGLTCVRSCEIDDNILFIHVLSMQILTEVGTDSSTVPRRPNNKEKRNNGHDWNSPRQ